MDAHKIRDFFNSEISAKGVPLNSCALQALSDQLAGPGNRIGPRDLQAFFFLLKFLLWVL